MTLFAKVHMYALNAYFDAQVAEELIVYLKSNFKQFATPKTTTQQRAQQLVATSNKARYNNPSYIVGLAYTQYYINGLADILYARILWPLVVAKNKPKLQTIYRESIQRVCSSFTTPYLYEELMHQPGILAWYWPKLVINPWQWVQDFAQVRCGYSEELDHRMVRLATREVEHQNIGNNLQVANILRSGGATTNTKIHEVRRVSRLVPDQADFILTAASTQHAAANWDKIFVSLLRFYE